VTDGAGVGAEIVTVTEASAALELHPTRVRTLIRRGDLAGERIGSQWVIPRVELARYRRSAHRSGRPFSQRVAWALLASMEGVAQPWPLAREERARVHRYAARPLPELLQPLGGRAATTRLSLGPQGLSRVGPTTRWLRGGSQATRGRSVIYMPSTDLEGMIEASNAVSDSEQPNLIVRTVDERWWPFGASSGGAAVWTVVAALDRYEAQEPISEPDPPGTGLSS
jgi:excisionase family DNA binding protein